MGKEPILKVRMCQVMLLLEGDTWDKYSLTRALGDRGWLPDNDHPFTPTAGLTDVVGKLLENNAGVLFKRGQGATGLLTYTLTDATRDRLPSHFQEQGWVLGEPERHVEPGRTAWERLLGVGF